MPDSENPTIEIQLDTNIMESIRKMQGDIILVRGHIIDGKLTLTGVQHVLRQPFAHDWPGGDAFAHNWPGGE